MNPEQTKHPRHTPEDMVRDFPSQADQPGYVRETPLGLSWRAMNCVSSYGVSVEMSGQFWCEGGQR